jgi:leader peptidase (prepilin peptidase)/N-methyltransferase
LFSEGKRLSDFDLIIYGFAFLFGISFGSFGNVLIYRWPYEESVLGGRSFCGSCGESIPWYYNIPVFSYFFLGGRCANCGRKFSIRYPIVEFLTGILFVWVVYLYGMTWTTLEMLILSFGLLVGSFIDWEHMILPDEITVGGMIVGLIAAALNPERSFLDALMGVVFGGGSLWLVAYIYFIFTGREGLGGGDIKLLAFIGSMLGWKAIPFVILCSSVVGSVAGILMAKKDGEGLKTAIPFGPFIALAAFLYLSGLKSVGIWYIQLFFPDV